MLNKAIYKKADAALVEKYHDEVQKLKKEIFESETDISFCGRAYYVSNQGNDSNDGRTPESAWATITRVNAAREELAPGDAVLFERGGVFKTGHREWLETVSGVTYSAYGEGKKPQFNGFIDATAADNWLKTDFDNLYRYKDKIDIVNDIAVIVINGGEAWGIKMDDDLDSGTVFNGYESFHSTSNGKMSCEKLKNDLEFWLNPETFDFYFYSKDAHPSERFESIELSERKKAVQGSAVNVHINNISFRGFGTHGIGYGGIGDNSADGLTVSYCDFSFIGGARQALDHPRTRFGNAIEIYGSAKNYTIHHCYAENVYDCCYTIQFQSNSEGVDVWFENIEFHHNIGCYSNTGLEVWLYNHPEYNNPATYSMKNLHLHDNYTLYSGYGWSHQRENKDGNIFYGDPCPRVTVYENCSIDHNVGLFASKWTHFLRYPGTNHYNFNNNIYFQHSNLYIGGLPENPETGEGAICHFKYDAETVEKLAETGFEPGSTFYYLDEYEVPKLKVN